MKTQQTALITGASSGIGAELTKLLAKDGYKLIISAKDDALLKVCARHLREAYNVDVTAIAQDLTEPDGAQQLYEKVRATGSTVDVLINDAGIGAYGKFIETPWTDDAHTIHLNIVALTQLTKLCLPSMLERGSGKILNLASIASFQPGPLMGVYYASKAYVLSLSLALSEELKDTGVTVTALCPGPTQTDFTASAGMEKTRVFNSPLPMEASKVAEIGYKAMMDGERMEIAGFRNKMTVELLRILPTQLNTRLSRALLEEK
jgi:short-subunit dehydrogenase